MSFSDGLARVFTYIAPLAPYTVRVVAVTLLVFCVFLLLGRQCWIGKRSFKYLGIFYEIGIWEAVRLSLSWIRFVLTLAFVFSYKELETVHYVLYLMIGILFLPEFKEPLHFLTNIFWLALETIGVFTVSILSGYLSSLYQVGFWLSFVYWLIAVFVALFSLYLFLAEMEGISSGRSVKFLNRNAEKKETVYGEQHE